MNRPDFKLNEILDRLRKQVEGLGHIPAVLLVDDDEVDLALCHHNILDLHPNATIETAGSGHDALEKLRSGKFDLVIADLNMPRMTGIQLIEEIRKQGFPGGIIAMSGMENGPYVAEALSRGALLHIRKQHFKDDLKRLFSWGVK